jgi:hypothetical protein
MKLELQIGLLAVLMAGCASESSFRNDPRAAVVGPAYLDYIQEFPRDHATQYYYPRFTSRDTAEIEPLSPGAPSKVPPEVQQLIMTRAKPTTLVQAGEGIGWSELEKDGIPFFWGASDTGLQVIPPAPAPTPASAATQTASPENTPKIIPPKFIPPPDAKPAPDLTPAIR